MRHRLRTQESCLAMGVRRGFSIVSAAVVGLWKRRFQVKTLMMVSISGKTAASELSIMKRYKRYDEGRFTVNGSKPIISENCLSPYHVPL